MPLQKTVVSGGCLLNELKCAVGKTLMCILPVVTREYLKRETSHYLVV